MKLRFIKGRAEGIRGEAAIDKHLAIWVGCFLVGFFWGKDYNVDLECMGLQYILHVDRCVLYRDKYVLHVEEIQGRKWKLTNFNIN